ncbi:glutamine synthetase [Rhodobacteraceae bacterium 63075]|nr:glutamine synthetase [Rhodobacteraceae bacterium 63075]
MSADVQSFRIAASDLNGRMRGKRLPLDFLGKIEGGKTRMPLSVLNVDITGADIEGSPLVFETGDADGTLRPTSRGTLPMPWLSGAAALIPATMMNEDGTPFEGDPRQALVRVLDRYARRGWQVRAATEMEFYLLDDSGKAPAPALNPHTGRPLQGSEICSLDTLDAFEPFFNDLYEACAAMGIPAQSALSEAGTGQFEIDIDHRDALEAADNAWLFKTLVKGLARKHGMAASFLPKPFEGEAGSGMHLHFSVVDSTGRNVFDDGSETGNDTLRSAVAGCLETMRDATLIFAPHGPSYDRMVPGAHAPTAVCWGYENRTVALRIPAGPAAARRIEHRVAGGDICAHLLLAAILGGAIDGIERAATPPAPTVGNAYEEACPQLAESWAEAITLFEQSEAIKRIFHPRLVENLVMTKRQEMARLEEIPREDHWKIYLESV